jgi:hypothetical protein
LLKELVAKRGPPILVKEKYSNSSLINSYISKNVSFHPQVNHSKISSKSGEIGFRKIKITAQIYVKILTNEKL